MFVALDGPRRIDLVDSVIMSKKVKPLPEFIIIELLDLHESQS